MDNLAYILGFVSGSMRTLHCSIYSLPNSKIDVILNDVSNNIALFMENSGISVNTFNFFLVVNETIEEMLTAIRKNDLDHVQNLAERIDTDCFDFVNNI
jgi:hypothetical protein